jgi:hypothetical protein
MARQRPIADERVLQGLAAERAERVLGQAAACSACHQARVAAGQDDALCDDHLGDALGMVGGWALGEAGRKLDDDGK